MNLRSLNSSNTRCACNRCTAIFSFDSSIVFFTDNIANVILLLDINVYVMPYCIIYCHCLLKLDSLIIWSVIFYTKYRMFYLKYLLLLILNLKCTLVTFWIHIKLIVHLTIQLFNVKAFKGRTLLLLRINVERYPAFIMKTWIIAQVLLYINNDLGFLYCFLRWCILFPVVELVPWDVSKLLQKLHKNCDNHTLSILSLSFFSLLNIMWSNVVIP